MRQCLSLFVLVSGLLAGMAAANAVAAEFSADPAGQGILSLRGEIAPGDAQRLIDAVNAAEKTGKPIDTFRLNSIGGVVEAGIRLAATVRSLKLNTFVGNGDQCASMCVLVYTAGIERTFDPGGLLAVHSVSTYRDIDPRRGYEDEGAKATTLDLARLYLQYGTPDGIVSKMITATGGELAYLSRADIEQGGFASPTDTLAMAGQRTMNCKLDGVAIDVVWHPDQTLQVGSQRYKIAESHQAKTGAWVAQADGPNDLVQAVFGGPDPRLIWGAERADCENGERSAAIAGAGPNRGAPLQKSAVSPLISQSP